MKFSPEILDELRSISPVLAGIEKVNTFSVPDGYFDTLSINALKNINTQSFNTAFAAPEGYFDNLSNEILNKIRLSETNDAAQELKDLSPMLYAIQNENVFDVPADYFANLSDNILEKVSARSQAKVVEIKRKDSVWRMAVAAVVTGAIAVSSLMVFNTKKTDAEKGENYVSAITEASHFKNEQQIDAGIASLSDDEIIKYLEKTGNDLDNETLTKSINDKALPELTDYLIDDKTLDSYLNNIEKNSKN